MYTRDIIRIDSSSIVNHCKKMGADMFDIVPCVTAGGCLDLMNYSKHIWATCHKMEMAINN
jgi:hypothetical protein